jgi:hypothetical protein
VSSILQPRRMSSTVPQPELLRALGRMARGLSALFWGTPLLLLTYVYAARPDLFRPPGWTSSWLSVVPPLIATALVWHGIALLGDYQRQERIWIRALDRAHFFTLVNFGLIPFLVFYREHGATPLNSASVTLLGVSSLGLLFVLNLVLLRLTAMLPDEGLRLEARLFTRFNRLVLVLLPSLLALLAVVRRAPSIPTAIAKVLALLDQLSYLLTFFMALLPLAMTMVLLWKVKETVLTSIIEEKR